jgi:hypothetical protein
MYRPIAGLSAACLMVLAACTPDAMPSGPLPAAIPDAATSVVTEPTSGPWARIVEGETGPGSLYALYIPRSWNGDAVYYAHGIRFLDAAVDLGNQDQFFAIRDALGARGFAVAWSSSLRTALPSRTVCSGRISSAASSAPSSTPGPPAIFS